MPRPIPARRNLYRMLRLGWGSRQMGAHYGVSDKTVRNWLKHYELDMIPTTEHDMLELAAALNTTVSGAHGYLRLRDITPKRWGGRRTITAKVFNQIVETNNARPQLVDRQPAGTYTIRQAAPLLNIKHETLAGWVARKGIPAAYRMRRHRGFVHLYTLQTLKRFVPAPTVPRARPAGYLNTDELATISNMTRSGVQRWISRGCPHVRGTTEGRPAYLNPEHVATWIEQTMKLEPARSRARTIRRWIASQERAA